MRSHAAAIRFITLVVVLLWPCLNVRPVFADMAVPQTVPPTAPSLNECIYNAIQDAIDASPANCTNLCEQLEDFIDAVCSSCIVEQSTYGWCARGNPARLNLIPAICEFLHQKGCAGTIDCFALVNCVGGAVDGGLTGEELIQLLDCSGCTADCSTDPCEPNLPSDCDVDGDGSTSTVCEDLALVIMNALECAAGCEDPPEEVAGSALCDYLAACFGGEGQPSTPSCRQVVACMGNYFDPGLIAGIIQNASCLDCSDLCGDGETTDPCDPLLPCDMDGDGNSHTCEDIKTVVLLAEVCAKLNDCEPKSDEDIADLICAYLTEGCGDPPVVPAPKPCAELAACILDLGERGGRILCQVLSCSECTNNICAPGEGGTCLDIRGVIAGDCDADGDSDIDSDDVAVLLEMTKCCFESGNCTESEYVEEIVDFLCELAEICSFDCVTIFEGMAKAGITFTGYPSQLQQLIECLGCDPDWDNPIAVPGNPSEDESNAPDTTDCPDGGGNDAVDDRAAGAQRRAPHNRDGSPGSGASGGQSTAVHGRYQLLPYPPMSPYPVLLSTGQKIEFATDLVVSLPGRNFSITRAYYGGYYDSVNHGASLVGYGWSLSSFRFITVAGDGDSRVISLYGPSPRERRTYTKVSGVNKWMTTGPAQQYFEPVSQTLWGVNYTFWRLRTPGAGYTDFFDSKGGTSDPRAGLMFRGVDDHGSVDLYGYITPSNAPSRLSAIHLGISASSFAGASTEQGARNEALAWVGFDWILSPYVAAEHGKLRTLSVYRKDASSQWIRTNQIEYTYHPGGGAIHNHVGSAEDLIQVARSTILNADHGEAKYFKTVTQYRYHNSLATDPETEDPRLLVEGYNHQLKMVIEPNQIEYFAQKKSQLFSAGPIELRVIEAADALLRLSDHQELGFNEGAGPSLKVVDLAAKIVGYTEDPADEWKVTSEYIQSACGCGGAAQGLLLEYSYSGRYNNDESQSVLVQEKRLVGSAYVPHRDRIYDLEWRTNKTVPYLVCEAIIERAESSPYARGRAWVWARLLDSDNRVVREYTPSALNASTYVPSFDANGDFQSPTYAPLTAGGLVYGYVYASDHRLTELRIRQGDNANLATFTKIYSVEFGSNANSDERDWLPKAVKRYRTTATTPTDGEIEQTTYQYGFRTSPPDSLAWIKSTEEAELETENGPGGTYERLSLFSLRGQLAWERSADNVLTSYAYDDATGAITEIIRNASTAGLNGSDYAGISVTGWGRYAPNDPVNGGSLTTTFQVDLLGRTVKSVSPGGVSSYTIRTLLGSRERRGIVYAATLTLPHKLDAEAGFDGPLVASIRNAGGTTIERAEYTLHAGAAYAPTQGDFTLASIGNRPWELARSTVQHHLSGLVKSTRRWHQIHPDSYAMGSYEDHYTYDALGRVVDTTHSTGSVTRNAVYDDLDRVTAVQAGTAGNLVTVAEYFYDDPNQDTTLEQGVGNGNLTGVRIYTGDNSTLTAGSRDTRRFFNWRDEVTTVVGPTSPYEFLVYDNQSRVIERGLFDSIPDEIGDTGRLLYARTHYSQRGRVYRQQVAVNPSDAMPEYLETHAWFDPEGRAVAAWGPNSPASKRVYDAHGRAVSSYITDRGGDAVPGAAGNYAAAVSLTGDIVLEQSISAFHASTGRLLISTNLRRIHDATATGALGATTGVATHVGHVYDVSQRLIRTVNMGTNISGDNVFKAGGSAPTTWPPTTLPEPGTSGEDLVSAVTYNTRGLVDSATDPKGRVTKYFYDDLDRQIAVVENFNEPFNMAWATNRWSVTSGLSTTSPDVNRTTSFVYDGVGNVTRQVAHLPDAYNPEKVQVTEYVYGTTAGAASTVTDSLITSADLLREVRYPDESTGEPGSTNAYKVRYAYNQLGELRSVIDQNLTTHAYHRDVAGRVTADKVTTFGANIADMVKRIGVAYDPAGRIQTVTSFSDIAATTPVNQVRFTYTPLWQVRHVYQDHDGVAELNGELPSGNTQRVSYAYSTAPIAAGAAGSNFSRLSTLTYPDGTAVTYSYGVSESIDDRISRVKSIALPGSQTFVAYDRLGFDLIAAVDYPLADVQLDRTLVPAPGITNFPAGRRRAGGYSNGPQGAYHGYDRFGRLANHAWVDGDLTGHASNSAVYNYPPIVHEAYTYDKASNRISKHDARPNARRFPDDHNYTYDALDRLVEDQRGVQGTSWIPAVDSQQWVLDMLGNWVTTRRDLTGDGDYNDSGDEIDDRGHNAANEITQRTVNSVALPFAYDDAGNLRTAKRSTVTTDRFTHDAWNRLVKHEALGPGDPPPVSEVGNYRYNGLHWRISKDSGSMLPFQQRWFYYSAAWQLIEEHVHTVGEDPLPDTNHVLQEFFGVRYVDDVCLRRVRLPSGTSGQGPPPNQWVWADPAPADWDYYHLTDAQFSSVAMLPASVKSPVFERVRYDAYGRATHRLAGDLDHDGDVDANDPGWLNHPDYDGSIGDADYEPDHDTNRDGVVDDEFVSTYYEHNGRTGVPDLRISDASTDHPAGPGPDNSYGYCGYVFSSENALYCVRFRWYDPVSGRWLQRDPARFINGMNQYQYVVSNPIRFVDSTGRAAEEPKTEQEKAAQNDPRNDPKKGCGITVNRAPKKKSVKQKDVGHEWIEISDPGKSYPEGIGFWPRDTDDLWNSPSAIYTPGGKSGTNCECLNEDDPYTGSTPDTIWETFPAKRTRELNPGTPGRPWFIDEEATLNGTPLSKTTCDQIRDCVRKAIVDKNYDLASFNCRHGADAILTQCGLTRHSGDKYTGDKKWTPIFYPGQPGPKW